MDNQNRLQPESIEPGVLVFDSDSQPVGRVSGVSDEGFEVERLSSEGSEMEELPGKEFGEGYIMWRCTECGEMDEVDEGLPEVCPNCSAPKEAITVVEED